MSMRTRTGAGLLTGLLLLLAVPAAAQYEDEHMHEDDCTFCRPYLFVEGAGIHRSDEALPDRASDNEAILVRGKLEVGTPTRHLGLFAHMEVIPSDGPSPNLTYGLQVWALPRFSDFNLTGGIGLTHRRNGIGDDPPGAYELRGWAHVGAEYQTPVHEIGLYAQAGTPLSGEAGPEFQLGLRHPVAPWKFHGIP